jgi:predicted phosphoadenosine phosphosulfate sulfurtransferase
MSVELKRVYIAEDVLSQARKRISLVFDNFEEIIVSVSSGKDSTVLYWLVVQEAQKRNRNVKVFFLDQEAEYSSSVSLMEYMMLHESVIPLWYQVPLDMTNATSYDECLFHAWGEGESWIRDKNKIAIKSIEGKYPNRFYSFFQWMEKNNPNTAFFIGLRAEESLNRLRAVIKNPGWGNIRWSTKTKGKNTFRFYPLYDWSVGDIWKFIADNNLPYNSIYDKMYQSNKNFYKTMRVSNLIHEKSFKCLGDLQLYEPETFDKLVGRVSGIHVASIYVKEDSVFETNKLPAQFTTWGAFREHLLETSPTNKKQKFLERFNKQPQEEQMYRKQVRQLLLNDYENNLDVCSTKKDKKKTDLMKWWDVL